MSVTHEDILNLMPKGSAWETVRAYITKLDGRGYPEIFDTKLRVDEIDVLGRQYLINMDVRTETIDFVDDLVDLDRAINYANLQDTTGWKRDLAKLIADMKQLGFKFYPLSNGGNDDYVWYTLEMPVKDFNEDKLLEATKLWCEFNDTKREFLASLTK